MICFESLLSDSEDGRYFEEFPWLREWHSPLLPLCSVAGVVAVVVGFRGPIKQQDRHLFFSFLFENYKPRNTLASASHRHCCLRDYSWRIAAGLRLSVSQYPPFRFVHENALNLAGNAVLVVSFSVQTWVVLADSAKARPGLIFVITLTLLYLTILVVAALWPILVPLLRCVHCHRPDRKGIEGNERQSLLELAQEED